MAALSFVVALLAAFCVANAAVFRIPATIELQGKP